MMHKDAMKIGYVASILLHGILLGILWLDLSPLEQHSHVTSVEMISLISSHKAQRQRVRGDQSPKKSRPHEKETAATEQSSIEKLGQDQEEAPELQGGTLNPQTLAVASYAQQLQHYIEKNRFYPRRAMVMEQTGIVEVRLKIDAQGNFISVEIIEKTPFRILNNAAHNLVKELKSFKPLPKIYRGTGEFIIPINYQIGRGSS